MEGKRGHRIASFEWRYRKHLVIPDNSSFELILLLNLFIFRISQSLEWAILSDQSTFRHASGSVNLSLFRISQSFEWTILLEQLIFRMDHATRSVNISNHSLFRISRFHFESAVPSSRSIFRMGYSFESAPLSVQSFQIDQSLE